MTILDITFDVYSDTPKGKDPDKFSSTLRDYHKLLWSKPLPNGTLFKLDTTTPHILTHDSHLGEFSLSSDAITHTHRSTKKMSHIVSQLDLGEMDSFLSTVSTIGSYIIFPADRIDGKMTINAARGFHQKLNDRFDLALECIRRLYLNEESPLTEVLNRYVKFFGLFENFKGYVDFFLLQDLVTENYENVKFWHPFVSFKLSPLPQNLEEYRAYKTKTISFVTARNQRMDRFVNQP
tara:strand:- start:61 stop:768 length:708 start_codon:yes stop_codon:yes gene_type:complete